MNKRFAIMVAMVAGAAMFGNACGKSPGQAGNRSAAQKQLDAQSASLQPCGDYVTPAGKPVQAYVVSTGEQAENLLLVVNGTGLVSMGDAATVKVGGKTVNQKLRWSGSSGWIVAINGDAKVITSNLGDKVGSSSWRPADPNAPYKFPVQLLKPLISDKTLKLPELDGPPEP